MKMVATLWENTYRAALTNERNEYLATVRIIVNIPISRENLPENAPEVEPQLFVLVEDATLQSSEIIDFETSFTPSIREKFRYEIPHVFYFYPSPEDMLNKGNL